MIDFNDDIFCRRTFFVNSEGCGLLDLKIMVTFSIVPAGCKATSSF